MEQEFLESGGEWQEFKIGDIFNIATPKKKFDANKITFGGQYPYVARGDKNNGIRGYITEDVKFLNNGQTISFGQDTATMFYQENPYFTGDKIKVFSLKAGTLNKLNSQFLISAMKKSFTLFSWGSSSFSEENLKQAKIQLPIIDNKIAFEYIEKYMRELQKERLRELQLYLKTTGLSSYELTNDEINAVGGGSNIVWDTYRIGDLFNVGTGSLLNQNELNAGKIKRISVKSDNNGIIGEYDTSLLDKARHFENFISVNFFGNVFYHSYLASVEMKVHTLQIKNFDFDRYSGLYFVTTLSKSLHNQFSYGNQLSSSMLKNDYLTISLPTKNNQIDFEYMATYIKAIQKLIIKDLVDYTQRELKAYEQVIG